MKIWSRIFLIKFVTFHTSSKTIWVISMLCLYIAILVFWICSVKFSFCSPYFMVVWMMLCLYYEQLHWMLLYHCYETVAAIALLFIFMLIQRQYEWYCCYVCANVATPLWWIVAGIYIFYLFIFMLVQRTFEFMSLCTKVAMSVKLSCKGVKTKLNSWWWMSQIIYWWVLFMER